MKYLRDNLLALGLIALTMVLAVVMVIAATSGGGGESVAGGEGDHAGGESMQASVLHADLTEFAINGNLSAKPGDVSINVTNSGAVEHNLVVEEIARSEDLANGETDVVDLENLGEGTYEVFCDISGHRDAGMETTMIISADATASDGDGHGGHGDDPDWAALDAAMVSSILEFPAETEGTGNQPLEPVILEDGTKYFELVAEIVQWEVEPGKFVDAWTYNGQVPGPAIHIDVGDKVQFRVINKLPMGTDVHWHGVRTPNEMDGVAPVTQELITAGTEFTYEFVAEREAIGMYHAHHHAQMTVPNGMFGTIQIGPLPIPRGQTISGVTIPSDLEVAKEFPMVLNDAGVIGYSLNGKSFPATEPIVVDEGDWIAVTYYNEGLQIHPMHMHQFPQLVFAKDGIALDEPYWADTVNIAPGERYTVLAHIDTPGVWVWHCHILTHVENNEGMFGMVTALVVNEKE